jgi:amino acid adenylation domain-containing protein
MENIEDIYDLSPMQQGMLFHTLYSPESGMYFEQMSYMFEGDLDPSALQQAWQRIIERHPVLRTAFYWEELDNPLQVVHKQVQLPWQQLDLRSCSSEEQQTQITTFLQTDRVQGFQIDKAPLMRCALIQLAEKTYQFVWSHHHILMDGWCLPLILKEVFAFYTAFCQEQPLRLAHPRPYRDYILWLQQQHIDTAKVFWEETLAGFTEPTTLRVEKMAGQQTSDEELQSCQLSEDVTLALQSLAQQQHLTLNTLVQGTWALLLSHYSGEDDVVFGATVSGRPTELVGVDSMVGLFINTLPVRVPIEADMSLLAWLQQLQIQQVKINQYAYSSLVDIQGWSDVPRGIPLFESIMVFENYPVDESVQNPDINIKLIDFKAVEKTNYPLTVLVSPGSTLSLTMLYDGMRFENLTITRLLEHFKTILAKMVAHPQKRVKELSLLTETEHQQLLIDFNNTQVTYQNQCLHHLVERVVEQTPAAVAVVFENQSLTYRELNTKANQLAHYLQARGVGADVPVGICMERSLEMVVGVLGILKAGGAYVSLDPAYPKERLAFMLEDAQVPVLLTLERLVEKLPPKGSTIVCLDTERGEISKAGLENPVSQAELTHLAYLIYTSGSTGKPKGVAMEHLPLSNLILWQLQNTASSCQAKTLQFASLSFDVSCQEIFSTWCAGSTLVLVSEEVRRDAVALLGFLIEQSIERLFLPFVALQQLADAVEGIGLIPSSLREIITAGEQLQITPKITNLFKKLSACTLHNHYGPSESHVVTAFTLTGSVDNWPVLPPIGRPIANTQIYLLNKQLQPVPIGVPGELHIGGDCLARGYLNRSALTAEKFISNPVSEKPESRLYKTGDLARYLPDGNIEFLGRIDNQVKIRGFRIELGEIEAMLAQHPEIREATAIVREDLPGDKRLIAYLVPNQLVDSLPDSESTLPSDYSKLKTKLRQFLKERLPDYMVPSTFVMLKALPLTPSGKVNRRSLPIPQEVEEILLDNEVVPRTPTEEILVGIWTDILAVKQVSIHANFFELGGHSLLATQVISRLRDAFSVELPVRQLFESPTVAALSQQVDAARSGHQATVTPIRPISREKELPLSFAQERLWLLNQVEGDNATYNIPAALRINGPLQVEALAQSLTETVRRHEILRTHFKMVNDQARQVIAPALPLSVPLVELQHLAAEEQTSQVRQWIVAEAQRCFDLCQGPLLRVTLLKLDQEQYMLLVTLHHIITDGWSIGVFVQEIATLYEAFSQDKPSPLPELPVQYADFAVWQREWLQGEVLETLLNYWKQQLALAPPVLELPTDKPRPAVQTFRGNTAQFEIDEELTRHLKMLSQQSGTTLFMTLLAAFVILLSRYSGMEDIVVGSPIANRNRKEIEPLIGCFINTLVLRADVSGNPTFQELLNQVRQVALDAYAHQDMPFEQLVEELQPTRTLSHTLLFQVMFILQNAPVGKMELPGLTITPVDIENPTAKFDLSLAMAEKATQLVGVWEYNTDLFEATTISRMETHFKTLLVGIVANPELHISELALLNKAERHQLLAEWNHTQADYPQDKCIQQLFENRVEQAPDACAVVFEDKPMSYRELNAKANQVAHYLRSLEIGPEVLVGICVERSLEMVMGLLGILKAGGAYVPLDPDYPKERIAFMLADAKVPVLLTQEKLISGLSEPIQHLRSKIQNKVVCLDTDWEVISVQCAENPVSEVQPSNLAYVIYTSGSTGRPKGVQICHQSVVNFLNAMRQQPGFTAKDTLLAVTTLSFDIAALELYLPLMVGASIVLVSREVALDGPQLLERLDHFAVTVMQATPATWRLLLASGWKSSPHLKVLCGGEALPQKLATQLLTKSASVWNLYGPTETTIWSATRQVHFPPPGTPIQEVPEPIGYPIANTQIYILDKHLQLVPIGVPGELHIGGVGLARGYLNRPELTAEKFILSPWLEKEKKEKGEKVTSQSQPRLYKTGDLARYRPDGNIEYLGRIDNQVKIRGFRIELGEIEAVLAEHPVVQETAVIVREEQSDDKRLVAYVVSNQKTSDHSTVDSELRRFLQEQLPNYMVPTAFVWLDALPLTPNGKIDRRALPAKESTRQTLERNFIAPRTPLEQQLAQIFEEILEVRPIGVQDNFFELGGHSLKAVILAAQIQAELQIQIPQSQIFQHPTIEAFANYINDIQRYHQQHVEQDFMLLNDPHPQRMFCVSPLLGFGIAYRQMAAYISTHALYGLDFPESDDPLWHLVNLIRQIQPEGPYILFGYSGGGNIAFDVAKALIELGKKVSHLILLDSARMEEQKIFSDEEIETMITENIEYFKAFLLSDPVVRMFIMNEYVKAQMVKKMRAFLRYFNGKTTTGVIHSDIHLITSIDLPERAGALLDWSEATTGKSDTYQGFGRHPDMIDDLNLEDNASIVANILWSIANL